MQITVNEANMKVENGQLIIKIDSNIEKILGINKVELSTVKPGQVIKSATSVEYIVLEQLDNGGSKVIRKNLLSESMRFDGDDNNFATSSLNKYLNGEYYKSEILSGFGENVIVDQDLNLLSLDGLDDYGTCKVKVGLLTIDDYRKYRKTCLMENMKNWWWLSTPDSTPSGYGADCVQCVRSGGDVVYGVCRCGRGVRPFFILKSNIFVSTAE